jgi:predicted GTPase
MLIENNYEKFYKTYENKYEINIKKTKSQIEIIIKDDKNDEYTSEYELDFLNDKLEKIIKFKELSLFYNLLLDNINQRKLIIKNHYRKVIETKWKIDSKKNIQETFTLILHRNSNEQLSLFFFSSKADSKDILNKINILELKEDFLKFKIDESKIFSEYIYKDKYEDNFIIKDIFFLKDMEIIHSNNEALLDELLEDIIKLRKQYGKILIFFYENNLENFIINLVKKIIYKEQIFIIIINRGENDKTNKLFLNTSDELKLKLQYKINKFNDIQKSKFDINNIFIINNNEYEKIYISLLKIYNYFNQLGDGFYRQLLDSKDFQIEGVKKEFNYLYNTHNFNILLWGETGSGKSTFINTILGEKKAYTQYATSNATFKDNYYVHKDYPIKFTDVCGFSGDDEEKINSDNLQKVYQKSNNIVVDINDTFTFNNDSRNKFHLLLFFIKYGDKIDIKKFNKPVIEIAKNLNIPIIIVVTMADKLFQQSQNDDSDSDKGESLMTTFKKEIEQVKTSLKKKKTLKLIMHV